MSEENHLFDLDMVGDDLLVKSDELNVGNGASSDKSSVDKDRDNKKKKNGSKTRKKQMAKNQFFQLQPYILFQEKSNLTREEKKNLQIARLFAKMEQTQSRRQEESLKKKRKLNPEPSPQRSTNSAEKSATNEVEKPIEPVSSSNSGVPENPPPVLGKAQARKVETKSLSLYLNPNFDLKSHQTLLSYIYEYQNDQKTKRKSLKENGIGSKGPNSSSKTNGELSIQKNPSMEEECVGCSKILTKIDKSKIDVYKLNAMNSSERFQNLLKTVPDTNKCDVSQILNKYIIGSNS
jgi:hypothetical protein